MWLLKRNQLCIVLKRAVPWIEATGKNKNDYEIDNSDDEDNAGDSHGPKGNQSVLRRLVSAYDPQKCGLVKYVRLTVALLCAGKPAMANLIVLLTGMEEKLQKARDKERDWDALQGQKEMETGGTGVYGANKYQHTTTDSHSHVHDPGDLGRMANEDDISYSSNTSSVLSAAAYFKEKYGGEIYLLKLIHGVYEDCEGTYSPDELAQRGDPKQRSMSEPGMGMRIDDVIEALSACACSVEDELVMAKLVEQHLIQVFYEQGQKEDDVIAGTHM